MLSAGTTNTEEIMVSDSNTALSMGSGTLRVFATPAMIALMEGTAAQSVEPLLEKGQTTVGTEISIKHVSASPVGAHIRCESTLTEVNDRALTFEVKAYDNAGLIGEGTHHRFIVDAAKFYKKATGKLAQHRAFYLQKPGSQRHSLYLGRPRFG